MDIVLILLFVILIFLIVTETLPFLISIVFVVGITYFLSKRLSNHPETKNWINNIMKFNSDSQVQPSEQQSKEESPTQPNTVTSLQLESYTEMQSDEELNDLIHKNLELPRPVNYKSERDSHDFDYKNARAVKNQQNNYRKGIFNRNRLTNETFDKLFREEIDYTYNNGGWWSYCDSPSIV